MIYVLTLSTCIGTLVAVNIRHGASLEETRVCAKAPASIGQETLTPARILNWAAAQRWQSHRPHRTKSRAGRCDQELELCGAG